jgi:hypothetical protein
MCRRNRKRALAHLVAGVADDLQPIRRVAGDTAVVLLVLGVSKQDGPNNLVARSSRGVGDGCGSESSALRVASGHDLGVRALCVGEGEQTGHFCDGGSGGAARLEVSGERGAVGAADALDPNVCGAVLGLEGGA